MKFIQSFWSKPYLNHSSSKYRGGWLEKKHFFMSQALSCLQLRQHYDEPVELVTDEYGYELLIEKLNLPYTAVSVKLDALNQYHPELWFLAKFFSIQLQQQPFIHIDGDVFLFERLDDKVLTAKTVVQNKFLVDVPNVYEVLTLIRQKFAAVPAYVMGNGTDEPIELLSGAIVGGQQIDILKDMVKDSLKLIDANAEIINQNIGYMERDYAIRTYFNYIEFFSYLVEGYFLSALAHSRSYPIETVLEDTYFSHFNKNEMIGTRYTHLMGFHKKNPEAGRQLEFQLRKNHPKYYFKILALLEEFII